MSRYEEYLVCKRRGHTPGAYRRGDGFAQCSYCKTFFKYISTLIEDQTPMPDDDNGE